MKTTVDVPAKQATQSFGSMTYLCMVESRDDRGRYRVPWLEKADVLAINPEDARASGVRVGDSEPLPLPHGISGGALWRFTPGTPMEEIWTADRRGQLVGISSRYLPESRYALLEAVSAWGTWFHEQIAAIDG